MAGLIIVRPDVFWSTSGWVFRIVLRSLAAEVADPELAASLGEIYDENLGMLSLPDLPPAQRAEVERAIRERLIVRSEQDLPASVENRAKVVDHIRGLVDALAGKPLEQLAGRAPTRRDSAAKVAAASSRADACRDGR
jgi:hypothetical protein